MKASNDSIQKVKAFFKVALLLNLLVLISPSAKASDFMTDINQIKQEMLKTKLEEQFAPKALFASTDGDNFDDDDTYAQRRRRRRGSRGMRRGGRRGGRNMRRGARRSGRRKVRRSRRSRRGGEITLVCKCTKKKGRKKYRRRSRRRGRR